MKCAKCTKGVTKRSPGLQCNKCSRWWHASCAEISHDQLNALQATESLALDWKCRTCAGTAKHKRLSCILPDAEEEGTSDIDTDGLTSNITSQILTDIRREIRETIRTELQISLQFYSDKIDDYELSVSNLQGSVKCLENTVKNLTLKNQVLEQRLSAMEQTQLRDVLELCGVAEKADENPLEETRKVAKILNLSPDDIQKAYRKKQMNKNKDTSTKQSIIVVSLREGCQERWMETTRRSKLTAEDIGQNDANRIYFREALSPHTAFLMWKTKTMLKIPGLAKYVWCKNGKILLRKEDHEKIYHIKDEIDILNLVNLFSNERKSLDK